MPKALQELEELCNADKRKDADELQFISAHMLHDLYLRWTNMNKVTKDIVSEDRAYFNFLYEVKPRERIWNEG